MSDDLIYIENQIIGCKVIVQKDISKIKNLNVKLSKKIIITKNNKSLGEFEATLKIIPKDVTITVSDIEEYLDGSIEEVSYNIIQ